jgi:predicted  nucleic acid-binding Zn-ribbon protein
VNADLERVIVLQRLDSAALDAERRLASEPDRENAFEARLQAARDRVKTAKDQLAVNQTARRELEKEVAVHQGRLSKYREQAMAVKTNQEYHAVQKEISFAQTEIKEIEEKILERMLEADEVTAAIKRSESELAAEQKAIDADRKAMAAEHGELNALLERTRAERSKVVEALDKHVLAIFDVVARRRNGVAVAEAREGICTICHVRLRPQVFNTVLRGESITQCDSCQRILYCVPKKAAVAPESVSQPPQ